MPSKNDTKGDKKNKGDINKYLKGR